MVWGQEPPGRGRGSGRHSGHRLSYFTPCYKVYAEIRYIDVCLHSSQRQSILFDLYAGVSGY